jgi:hypothetical protein
MKTGILLKTEICGPVSVSGWANNLIFLPIQMPVSRFFSTTPIPHTRSDKEPVLPEGG